MESPITLPPSMNIKYCWSPSSALCFLRGVIYCGPQGCQGRPSDPSQGLLACTTTPILYGAGGWRPGSKHAKQTCYQLSHFYTLSLIVSAHPVLLTSNSPHFNLAKKMKLSRASSLGKHPFPPHPFPPIFQPSVHSWTKYLSDFKKKLNQ